MKLSRDPALWEKLERLVLEWRDAGADGPAEKFVNQTQRVQLHGSASL